MTTKTKTRPEPKKIKPRRRVLNPAAIVVVSAPEYEPTEGGIEESEAYAREILAAKSGLFDVDPDGSITPVMHSTKTDDGRRLTIPDVDPPTTVGAKVAIYRALGLPMGEVDRALQLRARKLGEILEVVGGGREAPQEFIDLARKHVALWFVGLDVQLAPWMASLEAVMAVRAPLENGKPLVEGDALTIAKLIVRDLQASGSAVPEALTRATDEQLREAGEVVLSLCVVRAGNPGGRPKKSRSNDWAPGADLRAFNSTRSSRRRNPWGAAQDFAAVFGLHMPDRSDATRERIGRNSRH